MSDEINLFYSFSIDETLMKRVRESDYIFFYLYRDEIPSYLWNNLSSTCKVYGIGTKNFGESNGIIYSKRFAQDYFQQSIELDKQYEEDNAKRREEWGSHYIDLIEICRNEDGTIPVFSPEHKLLSQDCRHLTRGGAQYFAGKIDFREIFGE